MDYNNGFKSRMVQRMAGPEGISANALSKDVGVSQSTLSRWVRETHTVRSMGGTQNKRKGQGNSPRQWTPEEKLRVVLEASGLSEKDLGAFLRRNGVHGAQLEGWRTAAMEGAQAALSATKKPSRRKASPEAKLVKELQRELRRKDKALAEVTALLVLKKKMEAIWGDEGDDTPTKSGT